MSKTAAGNLPAAASSAYSFVTVITGFVLSESQYRFCLLKFISSSYIVRYYPFTKLLGSPARKFLIFRYTPSTQRSLASNPAHAIWGVIIRRLLSVNLLSGFSSVIGSFSKTSRPAAAISPSVNAVYKSLLFTTGPLATLIRTADFFIFFNAARSIRFLVRSLKGQ